VWIEIAGDAAPVRQIADERADPLDVLDVLDVDRSDTRHRLSEALRAAVEVGAV
jgi:hypothetical protein